VLAIAAILAWTPGLPLMAAPQAPPPSATEPPPTPRIAPSTPQIAPSSAAQIEPAAPGDPTQPSGSPKAVPDTEVHDFGTVWAGKALVHTFKVRNEGTGPLEISRVRPSCGCTTVGAYPKSIAPGESGEFSFSLDSKKIRSRFTKSITITTNEPENPNLKLELKGECKQYVDVNPPTAYFPRVYGGSKMDKVLEITNNLDKPLEISLDDSTPRSGKFGYVLETVEEGKQYKLTVTLDAQASPGMEREELVLKTNFEEAPSVAVNVTAIFVDRLEASPNPFVVISSNRDMRRQLYVTNSGASPVRVVSAEVDDPTITDVTVEEKEEGKQYVVKMTLPANYEPPQTGRTLTITTTDAEKPVIKVPVVARPKPVAQKRPAEELRGKSAPSFVLTTTSGKTLTDADLRDSVTVLDFFAVNCPHCKRQMPAVEKVREKFADNKNVRFLAVCQTMRKPFTQDEVVAIVDGLGWKADLAMNMDNSVGREFKAVSFPTLFVLDKVGKVSEVIVGNRPTIEQELTKTIEDLLSGKSVPSAEAGAKAEAPSPTGAIGLSTAATLDKAKRP
jgi:thiol-disulfide isomerase/thioredoxin